MEIKVYNIEVKKEKKVKKPSGIFGFFGAFFKGMGTIFCITLIGIPVGIPLVMIGVILEEVSKK